MIAYYDHKPSSLEAIGNGEYFYRWNIEEVVMQDIETSYVNWKCDEVVFIPPITTESVANKVAEELSIEIGSDEYSKIYREVAIEVVSYDIEAAKQVLLAKINAYDKSKEVEDFVIGEHHLWLDYDMRGKVRENLEICKLYGLEETTLRFGALSINTTVDNGWKMYYGVLAYAREAWNVTQQHIAKVYSMTSVSEIVDYDCNQTYKEGYPDIPRFSTK